MKRLTAAVLVLLSAVTAFGAVQDSGGKLAAITGTRESFVAKSFHRRQRGGGDSFRDSNGNTRLILAAVNGSTSEVIELIEAGARIRQGETVYFVKNDNSASWSVMISELPGNATLEKKSSANTANTAETVKTLDTKYFTFAIPKGWDGFEIDETSVKVENDDETASMYVEIEDLDGWEPDDLAEFYAKEHKAKDLKKEDGTYSFSYEEDGKLNVASFGTDGKVYVLVIQTAKNKAGFNEIAKLRGLMKRK